MIEASLSLILQNFDCVSNPDTCNLLRGIEPNSIAHESIKNLCQQIHSALADLRTAQKSLENLRKKCERFETEASKHARKKLEG